ncbi:MAG TPA: hypothetical protein VGS79_08080, partial [Puia sp.]|nr:hypothetical protein [Puia sp.]
MKRIIPAFLLAIAACIVFAFMNRPVLKHGPVIAPNASTKNWKLGVQLWTFMKFDFVTAIDKVDSSGIKYVEAFSHQKLGGGMTGFFGPDMTADQKAQVKKLLKSKGIHIVAMGVIVPRTLEEWKKYFEFGKEFGLSYFTAEP